MASQIMNQLSKMLFLFLKKFSLTMDINRLKKLSDFSFTTGEKIIIKLPKLIPLYIKFYEEIVAEELMMSVISADNHILHIGCGSIPATSILIAQKTDAHVTAIDRDPFAVNSAVSLIENHYRSSQITITCAEASQFPINNFDLLVISDGIDEIDKVLDHVSKSLGEDTQVILRTITAKADILKAHNLVRLFDMKQIKNHPSYGKLSSILLLKKKA